jgi:hypothetical protein
MKKLASLFLFGICFLLGYFYIGATNPVFAFEIQKLANVLVENDFTLGPGKIELFLNPGESVTRTLLITNRLGRPMKFRVEIEDFTGSPKGDKAVVLLGEKKSPYSLRDYLHPEIREFTLAHGERMVLPVTVSIPKDAEPGGLYGSVLISTSPSENILQREEDKTKGQVKLVARVGALFFVRIKGKALERGQLEKFDTVNSKRFYQSGPVYFSIYYKNMGNVHLDPYGVIEIKNILGKKIGEIEIEPYFAMPKSLRYREVRWDRKLGIGRYTATLFLNRGYNNIIDTAKISFWILPWKIILIVGFLLFIIIWLIWWIATHFEIRKKSK